MYSPLHHFGSGALEYSVGLLEEVPTYFILSVEDSNNLVAAGYKSGV